MTFRYPRNSRHRDGEKGQALALFVISLVAILMGAGLVLDSGLAFVDRRGDQNAADLGSMSGTYVLADYHTGGTVTGADVWNAVDRTVRDNGCNPSGTVPCAWSAVYIRPGTGPFGYETVSSVAHGGAIPPAAQGVEVSVSSSRPTHFVRLLGQTQWDVSTVAAGLTASAEGLPEGQVLPIAVDPIPPDLEPRQFDTGVTYQLNLDKDGPGNFSWLTWDGDHDANTLMNNVCTPQNPPLTFPVWVEGDNGVANKKAMRDCLDEYIANETPLLLPLWGCTVSKPCTELPPECNKGTVGEPYCGVGSNAAYHIIGLASFILQSYDNPAVKSLTGTFLGYYPYGSIGANWSGPPCDPSLPTCDNESFYIGLIR